jgi:RNA polymerase sigma-70 factor (ECF subfamily)
MLPDPLGDVGDDVLVRLVLADGSEMAFRALHRRHAPRAFRVAVRILGTESDAEDAVQEMWLRAVPRLKDFAWRSALGTWLTAIVVNVCREALSRRGRWNPVELEEHMLSTESTVAGEPLDLERAVASLPPGCRAAFILHDIEGFTHDEIAAQFGYTAGTSKSQVFRARRALRRLLADALIEEPKHES